MPTLLGTKTQSPFEPSRSLSNHRAAITSLTVGHGSTRTNVCVSTSKDKTAVVWNYHSGTLLRTFLLPSTPLCSILDPCDRAVYLGYENGSIQPISLFDPASATNSLYNPALQSTPIQVSPMPFAGPPADLGAAYTLDVSYDGTVLLSGHDSGKIIQWEIGLKKFACELSDLNAPVNNIVFLSPFAETLPSKTITVVKPKIGEGRNTFTGQFMTEIGSSSFESICSGAGFPTDLLEEVIMGFNTSAPAPTIMEPVGDPAIQKEMEELRKKNAELWELVNAQKVLQKRTYDKFRGNAS